MRRGTPNDSGVNIQTGKLQSSFVYPANLSQKRAGGSDMRLPLHDNNTESKRKFGRKLLPAQCKTLQHSINLNSPSGISNVSYFPESQMKDDALVCGDDSAQDSVMPISAGSCSGGRPTSLSSVASSRTSRSSDYFSSSSAGETHQFTPYNIGTQFELPSEIHEMENAGKRTVLKKLIESVTEEEEPEEGFVDIDGDVYSPSPKSVKNNTNQNKITHEKPKLVLPRQTATNGKQHHEVSVRDINKKLSEVDHLSPVATMAMIADPQLTHVDRVILELLETERMYVRALEDILAGYILGIKNASDLPFAPNDVQNLFGNIKDIYAFNRKFLSYLENCESNPVEIAKLFVSKDVSFNVYTTYCTNYPISMAVMTRSMKNPVLSVFFKNQQASLRHSLPLGSYLLKPVQRILKYHLILQELVKHCDANIDNYKVIEQALSTMTFIASHINEMRRKHEDAVHIQEIQSSLSNWQGNDLTSYGELVMEGELKLQGAKNERDVFLFDKMILITKRREDGFLVCKTHIMCSDLILLESVKDNPFVFLITPFDNQAMHPNNHGSRTHKSQYILTARTIEDKKLWTHNIKKLIIKNHHAAIPLQAQESIMNMQLDPVDMNPVSENLLKRSRFSNISLDEGKSRKPFPRFHSTLSSSTLGLNGKPRRRSESSTRKTLQMKALRRKHDVEASDDISSDSVPNTPTTNPTRNRFSFSRMLPSSSSKPEPVPVIAPLIGRPIEIDGKKEEKVREKINSTTEDTKKEPKYKQSVIYRRHKRRTSQPVTDTEVRLSIRLPSGDEGDGIHDLKFEDLEAADELLTFSVGNGRESVSWDIQIVEAVFERFKKEKIATNGSAESNAPSTVTLKAPSYRKSQRTYSSSEDGSSGDEAYRELKSENTVNTHKLLSRMQSGELKLSIKSDSSDEETVTKVETFPRSSSNHSLKKLLAKKERNEASNTFNKSDFQSCVEPENKPSPFGFETQIDDNNKVSPSNSDKKGNAVNIARKATPKIKRSLSSQSVTGDRRKYFERLKEIRDRRHSQHLLGADGRAIHTGIVRQMIEHHRETISSQLKQTQSPTSPASDHNSRGHFFSQVELGKVPIHPGDFVHSDHSVGSPSSEVHVEKKYNKVRLRRHDRLPNNDEESERYPQKPTNEKYSKKPNYRSLDLETTGYDRLSTLTTASLSLNFTSSSSSDECSSSNDEESVTTASPIVSPKLKKLTQTPMVLWRSYSEETGTNTRRSRNLMIETSSPKTGERNGASGKTLERPLTKLAVESKFSFKELGAIHLASDTNTDKMSEQVDYVWNDLESKNSPRRANSFESSSDSLSADYHDKRYYSKHSPSKLALDCNQKGFLDRAKIFGNIALKSPPPSPSNQHQNHQPRSLKSSQEVPTNSLGARRNNNIAYDRSRARPGRERSNCKHIRGISPSYNVLKLTQQFNNMSGKSVAPTAQRLQNRSLSAGPGKHMNNQRLSLHEKRTTNPSEDLTKRSVARSNSRIENMKCETNHSTPSVQQWRTQRSIRNADDKINRPISSNTPVKQSASNKISKATIVNKRYSTTTTSSSIQNAVDKSTNNDAGVLLNFGRTENTKKESAVMEQLTTQLADNLNFTEADTKQHKTNGCSTPSNFVSMFCKT